MVPTGFPHFNRLRSVTVSAQINGSYTIGDVIEYLSPRVHEILPAGYAFTWVFITIGLVAGNAQAAQGFSMLVVPFSFISSANVPVQSMPGWMQPFAANQPMSVIINAVRSLMEGGPERIGIGHTTGYWVVLSLIWSAGIMVVFGGLAVSRFGRTR